MEPHIPLPEYIHYAIEKLRNAGYQAVVIGGCVRDALLHKTPSDYDIATNALPEQIMHIFSNHSLVLQGVKHGTVGVVIQGMFVEITTFRIDGKYSDGRHPDAVAFTPELRLDVMRRDFTINAMAYDSAIGVIDEVGGMTDLKRRLVRCVGDPAIRFAEDRLRVLRALRFSSTLDFDVEENTAAQIVQMREGLSDIARERILTEFYKLLPGPRAGRLLREFRSVFETFLPTLRWLTDEQYSACAYAVNRVSPIPAVRLAALLAKIPAHDAGKDFLALRMDRATMDYACTLIGSLSIPLDSTLSVKRLLGALGIDAFDHLMDIRHAYGENTDETRAYAHTLINENQCVSLAQLAINGQDVIGAGVPKGPQVGKMLNKLLEMVMTGELSNDRDCLYGAMQKSL